MDDLIRRKDAVDALGARPITIWGTDFEWGITDQWEKDVAAIKAAPPAQRWTPVSEGQPKAAGLYLVTCYIHESNGKPTEKLTSSAANWHNGKWMLGGVVAWQPLPEPWRNENE